MAHAYALDIVSTVGSALPGNHRLPARCGRIFGGIGVAPVFFGQNPQMNAL